ncbi:hypothetical protein AAG570_009650 [Ranatra chinensis]|uniref:Uncharacterized protein n=1 Tax=Ranatra chinensis TaxID=642074 RepID=A0ABD0YPN6_9HEMI
MTCLFSVLAWTTVAWLTLSATATETTAAKSDTEETREAPGFLTSKEYFDLFNKQDSSGKGKPSKDFKYMTPIIMGAINKLVHLLPVAKLTLLTLFALVLFAKKAFLISAASFAYVMYDSMYAKGRKVPRITIKDRGPEPHHEYPTQLHEYIAPHHEYPVQHHEYPAPHLHEYATHHTEYPAHHHEYPVHHHEYPVHHHEYTSHHHSHPGHHGYDSSSQHTGETGNHYSGHVNHALWNKPEGFSAPQKVGRASPVAEDDTAEVWRRLLRLRLKNHRTQSKSQDDDTDLPIEL